MTWTDEHTSVPCMRQLPASGCRALDSAWPSRLSAGCMLVTMRLFRSEGSGQVEPIIRIEFEGGTAFWFDLFGQDEVGPGTSVKLEGGVLLTYTGAYIGKGIDAASWIEIALMIPPAIVSTAVVAKTIADRLVSRGPQPGNVRRLEIQRRTVEFEQGEIRRVIEETIRELPTGDA